MRKLELPPLTGIRFYAALFVVLSHLPTIPGMDKLGGGYLWFNGGVVGVSFFFVLSGFILTYNYADLFREHVSGSNYRRFVWDRLTKIYPVHLVAFFLVLPIAIASPNLPLDWRAVPFHLLLVQCFWPFSSPTFYNYLNVPSWSISCEWFFYLVAPVAIYLVLGSKRRWVPLLVAGGYAAGLGWVLWQYGTDFGRLYFVSWFAPSRLLEFLTGVYLARYFFRAPVMKKFNSIALQVAGIALIVAGANYRGYAPWPFWGGLLYVPGSALLVLGLAHGSGAFASHLSRPWLNRLGTASYSLYMIHAPLIRAAKGVCLRLGWEVHSWAMFAAVAIGMFLVVQSAALLLCYFYEIPVQKILRRLVRRHDQPSPRRADESGMVKV